MPAPSPRQLLHPVGAFSPWAPSLRRSCEGRNLGPQRSRFLPSQGRRAGINSQVTDLYRGSLIADCKLQSTTDGCTIKRCQPIPATGPPPVNNWRSQAIKPLLRLAAGCSFRLTGLTGGTSPYPGSSPEGRQSARRGRYYPKYAGPMRPPLSEVR